MRSSYFNTDSNLIKNRQTKVLESYYRTEAIVDTSGNIRLRYADGLTDPVDKTHNPLVSRRYQIAKYHDGTLLVIK